MPDVTAPHTVFVSHAHADNALADRYVDALKKRGLDVWYDRNNLQIGDSLSKTIEAQLRQRTALVVLYTSTSLNSPWVRREVAAFQHLADRDSSRLLIAVRALECDIPLLMADYLWADAMSLGFDAAIDALAKALRAPAAPAPMPQPQESVGDLLAQSEALMAQDKYAEAIPFLERASQRDPHSFSAWANLGRVYIETGEYAKALAACDRALALDEKQGWVWDNKGRALRNLKRYEDALAAFERALALDPKNMQAWTNKGRALRNLKRYEDALAACDRALVQDHRYTWAWNEKGYVYCAMGQPYKGLRCIERAIDLAPDDKGEFWDSKGDMLVALGRPQEALAAYEHALELAPNLVVSWHNKSLALRTLGRTAEAEAAERRARELEQKS